MSRNLNRFVIKEESIHLLKDIKIHTQLKPIQISTTCPKKKSSNLLITKIIKILLKNESEKRHNPPQDNQENINDIIVGR